MFFSACVKDDANVPVSNVIRKIVSDKNGVKWIATEKGLHIFDGVVWDQYRNFPRGNSYKFSDLCISKASDDEIWLAGNSCIYMYRIDAASIIESVNYKGLEGLLSDSVTAIETGANDVRYIGTTKGLSIFKTLPLVSFFGRDGEEILREYRISSIAAAKNGWVYAATYGGGVSRFKYTDGVSGATTFDSVWSQLKSNYVNTVIIVDDTCQWYGTNKGASFHTSHYTKVYSDWTSYTQADGLISDTVLSIAKDLEGNIWFGTKYGVSRLSGEQFTSFNTADGLISDKVNTISVDNNGVIWFGTDEGISSYHDGVWESIKVNE
jgi:ligand-binding sensor domain-containing protein